MKRTSYIFGTPAVGQDGFSFSNGDQPYESPSSSQPSSPIIDFAEAEDPHVVVFEKSSHHYGHRDSKGLRRRSSVSLPQSIAPLAWTDRSQPKRRRLHRSGWIRRAVLLVLFGGAITIIVSILVLGTPSSPFPRDSAERVTSAVTSSLRQVKDVWQNAFSGRIEEEVVEWIPPTRADLLKKPVADGRIKDALPDDRSRYVTTLSYGGHANQFIAIERLLHLAKVTDRVAVLPSLLPAFFAENAKPFSAFFNTTKLMQATHRPVLDMDDIKSIGTWNDAENERISCWSTQEVTVGHRNDGAGSMAVHRVGVDFWPLPRTLMRAVGDFDLAFDALRAFEWDWRKRWAWVEEVRKDHIPQKSDNFEGDKSLNLKDGFAPASTQPPDERFLCYDNMLFVGPLTFSEPSWGPTPREPWIAGEGISWRDVGQHIYFTDEVERHVDDYLMKIFGVSEPSKIPPFISMHLRRGDFEQFAGFTALSKYENAVVRVRTELQNRIDAPKSWRGPGRKHFQSHGIDAKDYPVLATTNEKSGSPFLKDVQALGWKTLDHTEMDTEKRLGAWWPTILDLAILARGSSFVGTERSTYSHLSGLRVKYWHGGVVEYAT